jgi:hypothetical protein
VSLLYGMRDGSTAESEIVSDEGVVGIALFVGGDTARNRAVVQGDGGACQLKASLLKSEFERTSSLQYLLRRYTQALITQTAKCNRHHSIEQQLCRWLLMSLDRLPPYELRMTQELIANVLGVCRESVTRAAGVLQEEGLLAYSRGQITVLNRPGLEARVYESYAVVKRETDQLFVAPANSTVKSA